MGIKVEYLNGVFKPLEKVENIQSGKVYTVFSDDELRCLAINLDTLKASEKTFEFCLAELFSGKLGAVLRFDRPFGLTLISRCRS